MSNGFSCKKWTKKELSLFTVTNVLIAIILFMLFANSVINSSSFTNKSQENICMTEKCVSSAATILKMINKSIDPCTDFYNFVCGNFIKSTTIPEEKSMVNTFYSVGNKVKQQLKTLLEEPIHVDDAKSLKLLKTTYKSCVNFTELEQESLTFVKKTLKDLGGWPLIEPIWNERKFDWKQLLYRLRRTGWHLNMFIYLRIDVDEKNASKRILTVTQPYISEYHALRRGINDSQTQAYYDYMVKMATLFGAGSLSAAVEMNEVLYFEMNLTQIIVPHNKDRNISFEYNPMTIKNLQESVHSIPWLQIVNNFLAPMELLTSKDVINVAMPNFFKSLEDLLFYTRKRTIANYMFWNIVKSFVNHLPRRFREVVLEYRKVTKGITRTEPRWEQCIKELDMLNVALSSAYIKKFFNHKDKEAVVEIATNIKEAFVESLEEANWIDSETKIRALKKVENMKFHIGYPDELLDEATVDRYYDGLELNPKGHYLKMNLNLSLFLHRKNVKKLKEFVIYPDWESWSNVYSVNGYYDQRANAIELMAGLMQDHFFDLNRPQYMNYGSVGEVIGHEIIHGFDDQGKQYDENANLVNWWTKESLENFKRKSECFIKQYGNFRVPEIKMKLNGINTLDENIADNAGFNVAYRGYLKYLGTQSELLLPGVSYTQKQIFWIMAASDGCTKYKLETLKRFVIAGRHAPGYFRIMVPFMNSEYFDKDFNCSIGTPMNPEKKCKIW